MVSSMNPYMRLSAEAEKTLTDYSWRGNVRELRNMAEYLASKEMNVIDVAELPQLKRNMGKPALQKNKDNSSIIDRFILNEGRELELYGAVLIELKASYELGERYGRQTLVSRINDAGWLYSEGEVRKSLSKLASYGFVRSAKGRGGSVITGEGLNLLEQINNLIENGILG